MTTTQQLTLGLVPASNYQIRNETWTLDEFPPNNELGAPEPDKGFVQTIINLGVMVPVIVAEYPDGTWQVRDGLRRIVGARMALAYLRKQNRLYSHVESIPVQIYEGADKVTAEAWTVILNEARSGNPIAEARAVAEMAHEGVTFNDIMARTGRTKAQVNKLLQLGGLRPELQDAALQGQITPSLAAKLAKESAEVQEWAVNEIAQGNKVVLTAPAPTQTQLPLARTWIVAKGDMPNLTEMQVFGDLEDALAAKNGDDEIGVYEVFKVA